MKKIIIGIFFFVLLQSISTTVAAQKVYATKTGQLFFNATGGIEKIAAVNNQVDSKFVDATGQIVLAVLVKGFKFENQLMEDHFNENYMESTQFPKADFKGKIENALMAMPFKAVYNLRPGFMKPAAGQQNVHSYYKAIRFAYPFLKLCFPSYGCELKELGTAMVNLVEHGYDKKVLEVKDIIKASRKA